MKKIILILCFLATTLSALDKTPSAPRLDITSRPLTTNYGVILPSEILKLEINNDVKIHLPDGTVFKGVVTKSKLKEKYHFECFGEINNYPNTGFGLVVTADGVYGAIVMRETDTIFCVKYSEEANGYILIKQITPTVRL